MAITLEPNYIQLSHWISLALTGHPGNASAELMGNKQMRASQRSPSPLAKPRVELQWSVGRRGTSVVGSSPAREHRQSSQHQIMTRTRNRSDTHYNHHTTASMVDQKVFETETCLTNIYTNIDGQYLLIKYSVNHCLFNQILSNPLKCQSSDKY